MVSDAMQSLPVRTMKKGTIVSVFNKFDIETSWSKSAMLDIGNGEYINAKDASLYTGKNNPSTKRISERNQIAFAFLAVIFIGGAYFFKK